MIRIFLLALLFIGSPFISFALTITTTDLGVNIIVDGNTYDISANCTNYLTAFADGDGFCTQTGACAGSPPYPLQSHFDSYATVGSDTFCIKAPTTGSVVCKMDATGSDGAWVLDPGSTISGTCDWVGWDTPPEEATTSTSTLSVYEQGQIVYNGFILLFMVAGGLLFYFKPK